MEAWQNMTDRERYLVMLAGILALFVAVYLLLIRPLAAYVNESERELRRAEATYINVASGAAEIQAAGGAETKKKQRTDPLRLAVARAARANNVQISRIQPGDSGSLTVWIEGVTAQRLYVWLQQLSSESGISPSKLNAQKSRVEGMLRIQIQFEE